MEFDPGFVINCDLSVNFFGRSTKKVLHNGLFAVTIIHSVVLRCGGVPIAPF